MSIETFRKILDRCDFKIRAIQLYGYSDPCLHKDLHLFIEECSKRKIKTTISTMLQTTNCDFKKVIEARPSEFRVSFAGLKNMGVYQKGGKPEVFMKKLDMVSRLPRYKETRWTMFFHVYKDNRDEIEMARVMAKFYKFDFIPYPAIFMPNEKVVSKEYTEKDREAIDLLLETPEENIARLKVNHNYCPLQTKQFDMDANGTVDLCQLIYEDRFKIGSFLEVPSKELRKKIMEHPFCKECKRVGGHTYQLLYAPPYTHKNPIKTADKKRYAS
jgi:hypothetical protein